ncbi:uncharacterized protein SOCEGT47_049500 [Sorangium cellulosum]|uniref:Uncharacterized protein n=1 Tax=Sorangium cellulosum TaxID=56 RepID=A0A4P2Q5Z6_SORCE|nr:uncharacterized protein SOCEGT47_049500 [Sorangium cellulosum]
MNAHAMRRALQPFLLLLMGPAFCVAVGITMLHAWLDVRRRSPVRHLAHAAARQCRSREREHASL